MGPYQFIKMGFVPMVIILCAYICIFICMKLELYKYFQKTEAEKQEDVEAAKRAFSGAPDIIVSKWYPENSEIRMEMMLEFG